MTTSLAPPAVAAVDAPDVTTSLHEQVLTVSFNRPAQRNAMTASMEQLYRDLLHEADRDPGVRAIVVTGTGAGFCAGADLTMLGELSGELPAAAPPAEWLPPTATQLPGFPLTVSKPLIAAVNGACVGLGFAHALYCDLRFAAAGAKLSTAFARRGLIAEYATAWLLPRIIGRANALDLLLSGRTITAEEALTLGLVQRVLPADELLGAAQDYAQQLAALSSPTSMAIIKKQVNDSGHQELDAALSVSLGLMLESFGRPDLVEGVASFLERRPPSFAAHVGSA